MCSRGPQVFAGLSGQKEELTCGRDAAERGPPIPTRCLWCRGEGAQAQGHPPLPTLESGVAERPGPGRDRGHRGLFPELWNPKWRMVQMGLGPGPLAPQESLLAAPILSARQPGPFPAPFLSHSLLFFLKLIATFFSAL